MKNLILLLFIICFPFSLCANWPMYMGNHYLTGNNDEIVPDSTSLNWYFKAPSFLFYPVPHKNIVFANCMDKNIYALNKITGEVIWKCNLGYPAMKSPVTYKNYVLVTTGSFINCIEIDKGKILWSRKEGISVQLSTPIVINGIVYYGSRKFFYGRLIQNGHLVWKNTQVSIYGGTPIYWNKGIYFISKNFREKKSHLFCINAVNGTLKWKQIISSDANIFTPVIYNGRVYIGAANELFCFDALTGKLLWVRTLENRIASAVVIANNRLYVSMDNQKIYMLSPEDGHYLDSCKNYNKQGASFSIIGETLFIPTRKGALYSVGSYSKKINWKFQSDFNNKKGTISSADGRIYMAVGDRLYSLSPGILPPPSTYIASSPAPKDTPEVPDDNVFDSTPSPQATPQPLPAPKPKIKKPEIEKFEVALKDPQNNPLDGEITVEQDNKITHHNTRNGKTTIKVDKDKEFSVTAKSRDHFIKTVKIDPKQKKKSIKISMDKIELKKSYIFQNIEFKYNSAELTQSSIPTLAAIAKLLNENPALKIEIRGHTDSKGKNDYNLKLSYRRAEKVKEYLVKNGVLDTTIKSKGFGESKPVAKNNTEEGRIKNRRVEFFILSK